MILSKESLKNITTLWMSSVSQGCRCFLSMYSLSTLEQEALQKFIQENLNIGFICPSKSGHGAPVLFVHKKDSSLRLGIDFRNLNKITKKDRYPLPLIKDLLNTSHKGHLYTKIDLCHAYHLVRVAEGDKSKTVFHTKDGSFKWLVILEGLTNTPAAFQRFMNNIFSDMLDVSIIVYLNDILVYFNGDLAEHRALVHQVLCCLRKHKLFAKVEKCAFHENTVEYLGYNYSDICIPLMCLTCKWPSRIGALLVMKLLSF